MKQEHKQAFTDLKKAGFDISIEELKVFNFKSDYDGDVDADVIDLCNAVNSLPALHTIESCSGHGRQPFQIWIRCDGTSMQGLFFLTRCIDRRYFQYGWNWGIYLEVADVFRDGILPTNFVLGSTNAWSDEKVKGKKACNQAKDLLANMIYHLNHINFIKGFKLDLEQFNIKNYDSKKHN